MILVNICLQQTTAENSDAYIRYAISCYAKHVMHKHVMHKHAMLKHAMHYHAMHKHAMNKNDMHSLAVPVNYVLITLGNR